MTPNYQYFLAVAEDLNISQAAKKLHISQQCLSSFIQRLEKEQGVLLLNRKPKLTLTAAGEVLQRYFQKLQLLENNLESELDGVKNIDNRIVNIGIHSSRVRFLLPVFTKRFTELCHHTHLNIMDGLTREFEQYVASGKLDMFIGLNPSKSALLTIHLLLDEKIYLVISELLLKRFLGVDYIDKLLQFQNGVNLSDFVEVPFIINHQNSNLTTSINLSLEQQGIKLNSILTVNGNDMHLELSNMGLGACFVPRMFLPMISKMNERNFENAQIYAFPINDFSVPNRLCLVHSKDLFLTKNLKEVISSWKRLFIELYGTPSDVKKTP